MRQFELHRDTDVSAVSGTGVVADGVVFDQPTALVWPDGEVTQLPPGWVRLVWRGRYQSTVLWPSVADAMAVHGHGGATRLVWCEDGCKVLERSGTEPALGGPVWTGVERSGTGADDDVPG